MKMMTRIEGPLQHSMIIYLCFHCTNWACPVFWIGYIVSTLYISGLRGLGSYFSWEHLVRKSELHRFHTDMKFVKQFAALEAKYLRRKQPLTNSTPHLTWTLPDPSRPLFPEQCHLESDEKVYLSTGGGISRALVIPRLRSRRATRVQNIFISLALSHLLPAFSDHLARENWRRSRLKALRGFSAAAFERLSMPPLCRRINSRALRFCFTNSLVRRHVCNLFCSVFLQICSGS